MQYDNTDLSTMIVPEVQLTYDRTVINRMPPVTSSKDAATMLANLYPGDEMSVRERFYAVMMANNNRAMCALMLGAGGLTSCPVDERLLFAVALKSLATGIILCHNHPTGKLQPSDADLRCTSEIKKIAEFHNIRLLDHIILVPGGGYYSFLDEGCLC